VLKFLGDIYKYIRNIDFSGMAKKAEVLRLYKNLLWLGRDWPEPQGYRWFSERTKKAFRSNSNLKNEATINKHLERGYFVEKEIQTLYYLKKYRAMKKRYNSDDETKWGPAASQLSEYVKELESRDKDWGKARAEAAQKRSLKPSKMFPKNS